MLKEGRVKEGVRERHKLAILDGAAREGSNATGVEAGGWRGGEAQSCSDREGRDTRARVLPPLHTCSPTEVGTRERQRLKRRELRLVDVCAVRW